MKIKYLLTLSFCAVATNYCSISEISSTDYNALREFGLEAFSNFEPNNANVSDLEDLPTVVALGASWKVEKSIKGGSQSIFLRIVQNLLTHESTPDIKSITISDPVLGALCFHMLKVVRNSPPKLEEDLTRYSGAYVIKKDRQISIGNLGIKEPDPKPKGLLEAPPAPTPAQQAGPSNTPRPQQTSGTGQFKCRYCAQAFKNAIARGLHQENCPNKK